MHQKKKCGYRGSRSYLRTQEVPSVLVWAAVHPRDSLTPIFGPEHCNTDASRWSLMIRQYNYTIEYRSFKQHGNADALSSRLPVYPDLSLDREEGGNDVGIVCTIRTISSQFQPQSRIQLKDATNRDPVLSEVKHYICKEWPQNTNSTDVQEFKKDAASLSVLDDCLINSNRVVIPEAMQPQILDMYGIV